MKYEKLDKIFKDLCKQKNLKEDVIKNMLIKQYINDNLDNLNDKYIYYFKYDNNGDKYTIFGDDGKFYELNDGSIINKEIFEKSFQYNNHESIKINPNEFFNNSPFQKFGNELKKQINNINISDNPPRVTCEIKKNGKVVSTDISA